jgi:cold shock CspA family protein
LEIEDTIMKHFGVVQSFDEPTGHGSIRPDNGGRDLAFERRAILSDQTVSPRSGVRLSYHLSGLHGRASAVDLQTVASLPKVSVRKSFSVFRSAAEEAATKLDHDNQEDQGRHMSATEGRVVRTPGAALAYKVVLKRGKCANIERCFGTMRESEAFIRSNTPLPLARNTLLDQEACAL